MYDNSTPLESTPEIVEDKSVSENVTSDEKEEEEPKPIRKMQKARRGKPYSGGASNICKLPKVMVLIEKSKGLEEIVVDTRNEKEQESNKEKNCGKTEEGQNMKDEGKKGNQSEKLDEQKLETNSSENDKNMVVKEGKNETDVNKEEVSDETEEEPKNEEHVPNDDTVETSGYHIESMLAYINDDVIVDEVKGEGEWQMVEAMLFKGETESEKEEKMEVIGQSLVISHLEDDLDEILKTKISVKDTEERIYCLKQVIELLKGFEIKKKGDSENKMDASDKKELEVKEGMEEEPESGKIDVDIMNKKSTNAEAKDDGNVIEEATEEEEVHDRAKNYRENETETEKEYVKADEMSETKDVILIDKSKVDKSVCFEIYTDDTNEICLGTIQVKVANMFKTLAALQDDGDAEKVDEAYVNFPSSQSKCDEYIKDMMKKQNEELGQSEDESENKKPYTVDTEDITDDEKNKEDTSRCTNKDSIDSEDNQDKNKEEEKEQLQEVMDKNDEERDENPEIDSEKSNEVKEEIIHKLDDEQIMSEDKNEEDTDLSKLENTEKTGNISDENDTKEDEDTDKSELISDKCPENKEEETKEEEEIDESKIVANKEEHEDISRKENKNESKESEKTESETVKCEEKEEETEVIRKNGDDSAVVVDNTSNLDESAELVYLERYLKCFYSFFLNYILQISDIC